MRIKYGFKVIEIEIEDAKFKVKEMDRAEIMLKHIKNDNGIARFNMVEAVNSFFKNSVSDWENLIDGDTGMIIKFSDEAKENIPFNLKADVFNKVSDRSVLNTEKKKVNKRYRGSYL